MSVDALKQAALQNPRDAKIHQELGRGLFSSGQYDEALRTLEYAATLAPDDALIRNDLGAIYNQLGRTGDAIDAFRKATELKPDLSSANYNLGMLLAGRGQFGASLPPLETAMKLDPDDYEIRFAYYASLSNFVPPWHFPMVHDQPRNEAYRDAIRASVTEGMSVLEIGTGTGLLAMLAVQAGAAHVTTCEQVPEIAERARRIIARNGFEDRITVLDKNSRSLVVGKDMPGKADILISEILGSAFLGEQVLPSVMHARQTLLKPGAPMIPRGGATMAGIIDRAGIEPLLDAGTDVMGFDLSAFNDLAPLKTRLPPNVDPVLLSAAQPAYSYDLDGEFDLPLERPLDFTILRDGTAMGAALWMKIRLTDDIVLENAPPEGLRMHWPINVFRFREPRAVRAGQTLSVVAGTDGSSVWVHD
jgi:hypothetical protein